MRRLLAALLLIVSPLLFLAGPAHAASGIASIYGNGDGYAGRRTASGEIMNPHAMTAAMRQPQPLGSHVTVTHGNRSVRVKINDRGPFVRGRIIDLSPAAARAIGCAGLCHVTVTP